VTYRCPHAIACCNKCDYCEPCRLLAERAEEWFAAQLAAGIAQGRAEYVALADRIGFVNRAEGQGGYEVADVDTIARAWREMELAEEAALAQGRAEERERIVAMLDAMRGEIVPMWSTRTPVMQNAVNQGVEKTLDEAKRRIEPARLTPPEPETGR
jgi:hypothetical protein